MPGGPGWGEYALAIFVVVVVVVAIVRSDTSAGLAALEGLDVDSDNKLVYYNAEPGRLGKSRAVDIEAEAADLYFKAVSRGVGEAAQREVSDALDGNAGDDSEDGEKDEGGQIQEDEDATNKGRVEQRHVGGAAAALETSTGGRRTSARAHWMTMAGGW